MKINNKTRIFIIYLAFHKQKNIEHVGKGALFRFYSRLTNLSLQSFTKFLEEMELLMFIQKNHDNSYSFLDQRIKIEFERLSPDVKEIIETETEKLLVIK